MQPQQPLPPAATFGSDIRILPNKPFSTVPQQSTTSISHGGKFFPLFLNSKKYFEISGANTNEKPVTLLGGVIVIFEVLTAA